ncbi:ferritin-like domain-containing protein [Alkaliphilus sp. B6464]|uniref:ferritin-like domain-containing protein n=1 Tax=Alkaliphilus sp. B6464 TaxID=2731219 RepID=UPI001BA9F431|nr:ferritin-like domain-containing protein [Alkaliphilus sp. B6464]QUH20016.1 ferritin-like domain-containing protein [Alkaliphilus sp. B6464]
MYQSYNNYSNYNHNCNIYYMELIPRLEEYIQDELQDSAYYKTLAKLAPTQRAKDLIMEFSADEAMHAENFQRAYFMITGRYFMPQPLEPVVIEDYEEALKIRILAETKDYKKYGDEYLRAPNKYLKDLFFETRTVEAQHAMRIPILFEEEA